jgi:translation initiation factor IF-2
MSETKTPGEKKLSVSKLTLKPRTETGTVRQSFSHGRSKQVVVEVKKRRTAGAEAAPAVETKKPAVKAKAAAAAPAPAAPATPAAKSGVVLRTLTEEERAARAHALADTRVREAEERRIAEEEAKPRAKRAKRRY